MNRRRVWIQGSLFGIAMLARWGLGARPAAALCVSPSAPDLLGTWVNIDAATRGMRQIQVAYLCDDVRRCDAETGQCSEPRVGYYIRPFGSCSPTDCDWGLQSASLVGVRSLTSTINQTFATRRVNATLLTRGSRAGQLRVSWRTTFTDGSGRENYHRLEYFTKTS